MGSDYTIEVRNGSWPKISINSALFRGKKRSLIVVHQSLNWCYTRFAITVELGNIILSQDKSLSVGDGLIEMLAGLISGIETPGPVHGEMTAIALAIELLMPMHHAAKMQEMLDARVAPIEIATAFRVPLYIAEWSVNGGWAYRKYLHATIKDVPPKPTQETPKK